MNGENSPITAKIYQNMGNHYLMNAQYQLAFGSFKKSFEMKKNIYGEQSAEIILPKISIAHCNVKLRRYSEGLKEYRSIFILFL